MTNSDREERIYEVAIETLSWSGKVQGVKFVFPDGSVLRVYSHPYRKDKVTVEIGRGDRSVGAHPMSFKAIEFDFLS